MYKELQEDLPCAHKNLFKTAKQSENEESVNILNRHWSQVGFSFYMHTGLV